MVPSQSLGRAQPYFVSGDVDGFFGLLIDNLIQFLLIIGLGAGVLGFPRELILGTILPGAAVSVLVGNVFYAHQAQRLSAQTGRRDVTALPYGLNTVSLFAYVFLVMLPVRNAALERGMGPAEASTLAWQVGLASCFTSALMELGGSLVADWVRRITPRAALLGTLAGIAISFIAMDFAVQTFESPLVALLPLAVILTTYFAQVKLPLRIPGGAWAVALGTLIAWGLLLIGEETPVRAGAVTEALDSVGFYFPLPVLGDLWAGLSSPVYWDFFVPVMLPMGLFNVLGSLQNIESAAAAGDSFPTRPAMVVNGVGSLAAAMLGSCFPTTIYIGHPGWKALGARSGYSTLNGVFFCVACFLGLTYLIAALIPMQAGMAIVLWIGIIITAQAFQVTAREHAAAVAVGLFPALAGWGVLIASQVLSGAEIAADAKGLASTALAQPDTFLLTGLHLRGLVALSQGFMLTSMIWAAASAHLLDRRLASAAKWVGLGAVLSFFGFIHAGTLTASGATYDIGVAAGWRWSVGYLACAVFFALTHVWVKRFPQASTGAGH